MTEKNRRAAAGAAAGLVNGIFGGGGGMVLLPLLSLDGTLPRRSVFATCVAVMVPLSAVSAAVYWLQVRPDLMTLLPCFLGGLLGGAVSGLTFEKVPVRLLKGIFGAFLIYGGVRYLL